VSGVDENDARTVAFSRNLVYNTFTFHSKGVVPVSDEVLKQGEAPEEENGSIKQDIYYWTQALVVVMVCLILAVTLLGRVIRVEGTSMVPTLHENDLLLLQSLGYTPRQGDVVVLHKDFSTVENPIVKRVIAVGGQHVRVDYAEGKVYVDGVALDEPYINGPMLDPGRADLSNVEMTVPEGSIYVLGDNRNNSSDSRHVELSAVDNRYVLGRVLWVMFPFKNFGTVN